MWNWTPIASPYQPTVVGDGLYLTHVGATLTAKAFDSVTPGLGKWLVSIAAWLFAISTMISWSYYGEQGMVYLAGEKSVGTMNTDSTSVTRRPEASRNLAHSGSPPNAAILR